MVDTGKFMRKLAFVLFSLIYILCITTSCARHRHRRDNQNSRHIVNRTTEKEKESRRNRDEVTESRTVIPLENEDGVYFIKAIINDVPMKFVFDTGASAISMSMTEAAFLIKQGTLTEDDLRGVVNFQDAEGELSEGQMVRLRTVQLGDKVIYNVDASIVPNQNAPLLLGQSVLQQFGRFSIDNKQHVLILE